MEKPTIQEFVIRFAQAIEGLTPDRLSERTTFHELPEWDSLAVLSTLALVDACFGVQVTADELRECRTVRELYEKAKAKSA